MAKRTDAPTHRRTERFRVERLRAAASGLAVRLCLCALVLLLLGCRNSAKDAIAAVEAAADSADQLMIGLRQILTKDGVRQASLEADTAFIYENAGRVELRKIRVTFYSPAGAEQSVLNGREGSYWMRTGEMEARGNVVVIRTADGARLASDMLRYDPAQNQVTTDQPFTADKGEQHIEGNGFVCDPGFTNCLTQRPRGTAGRFLLPGQ